jgi:Tol biopolymer transport system component/uncharacterized membrane protein
MDDLGTSQTIKPIQVTLQSLEYKIASGGSIEIPILLTNPNPTGDYFRVSLVGIPTGWFTYSGQPAVWVPEGGQEKAIFVFNPPATTEDILGSYPARVRVVSQSDPNNKKDVEIILTVLAEEKPKETFSLRAETDQLPAIPGSDVEIPLILTNLSQESEFIELTVQGVPSSWVSLPAPVITLPTGEEKKVNVILQIPASPEIRAGYLTLKVTATSQNDPGQKAEAEVKLVVAVFESQGQVGVMLGSVQFSSAPGGSLGIPITILNRGLDEDTFRIGVEGIPLSWISTTTPVNPLKPGEKKEVSLLVRPPLSPSTQAGRHKFLIVIASQTSPDRIVRVDCILTISEYAQFNAELEPQVTAAGQPVRVRVKNEGNTQQLFRITCLSQNDQLGFEYLPPEIAIQSVSTESPTQTQTPGTNPAMQAQDYTQLTIPAGESAAFTFTARPRQRSLIGGPVFYSYQVSVKSKQKEVPNLAGQVSSSGLIPFWALVVALVAGFCLFITFGFYLFRVPPRTSQATQTAAAKTAQAGIETQVLLTGTAISAGVTQTIIANQTAAAIAGQQDTDGDGLINQREAEYGTDPNNPDTDGDGLLDGEEVYQTKTNPLNPDTDGDGLMDGDEVRRGTNPLNPDTDGDLLKDGDEVRLGTDPLKPDTDGDGLVDGKETPPCPNPLNPDTDGDGIIDGKDLDPCDPNNPSLTATAVAAQPSGTPVPPTSAPTQTPGILPTTPPSGNLPRFSGTILFESDRDGNPEVYSTDNAGHLKRLTSNPNSDIQAAWSPDMTKVVFTSNRDGQNEIYLMNADGSNPVNLTNNPADDQQPSWSNDGNWVAFTSNRDGNYEIYILRLSNNVLLNLTNNPANDTQPSWLRSSNQSVAGEFIVFTSDRDGNQEIYLTRTDGTLTTNLTANPANDQMAKSSPDGTLIAFTTNRNGNPEVYTMQFDGQNPTNLTNNPASDFGPVWSSDQTFIAFTTDRDGNREVYLLQPGTPGQYNLTNNPYQDQVSDWR